MKTIEKIEALEKELAKLKEECKVEYPICCKSTDSSLVVLFTELNVGTVLQPASDWKSGDYCADFVAHTDKNNWEQIPYNKERELFDKQVVYCWDNEDGVVVEVRFYDAINDKVFTSIGKRNGLSWNYYEAVKPDSIPKVMIDNIGKLRD